MRISNFLCTVLSLITLVSCDWIGHEPRVEGEDTKNFDYKAQDYTFKVVRRDGGAYDHQVGWHIRKLRFLDRRGEKSVGLETSHIDTLANGDMRIAYDWITCIVPRSKTSIYVVLTENKTDSTRVAVLDTKSDGKMLGPGFIIYQHPQGK